MISTKQLTYALAVQKTLHFKKAAEACNISQSALSTALNELEKLLGLKIFERDNKKVLVTPIGEKILAKALSIKLELEEIRQLAECQDEPLSHPMTIGVIPTIAPYLLPRILPALNTEYPQLELKIIEEQSHVLVDMVRKADIDTAILALPYPCNGLLTFDFWDEDFFWVAKADSQYAAQQEITSQEVGQTKLMLLRDGHCLKDQAISACQITEQQKNLEFGATSLTTLIHMVSAGMGSTLIPAMAVDQLIANNNNLSAVHLNEPGPHRKLAFVVRPNYPGLAGIERLITLCKKQLLG